MRTGVFSLKRLTQRLKVRETTQNRTLGSGWRWARTAERAAATATTTTISPCRFLEKGKKQIDSFEYAEELRAEAEVQAEEVEAAVASLHGAIVAFEAAEDEGFDLKS